MKKRRKPLRFALSGALLVPGLLGLACGPDNDDATMNVALPPEHEPVPNPAPPEVEERPTGNVAVMEPEPMETANPVGEEPPAPPEDPPSTDPQIEINANPVGDQPERRPPRVNTR